MSKPCRYCGKVHGAAMGKSINQHEGSKYLRTIHPADGVGEPIKVDIYSVIVAYRVTCPGRQQAIKKLLMAGLRGKGSQMEDLVGAEAALARAMDLQKEAEAVKEIKSDVPERHDT